MTTAKQRKPRFKRASGVRMQLTERDVEILRHVHRHRFLSSVHLGQLASGSEQGITRRLQKLYHAGYLDRPREQIERYTPGGKPIIHGLGNRGADVLQEYFGIERGKLDWTSKNREVKRPYLFHTLDVAEVMVAFELACRARGNVRLLHPTDVLTAAPETTRRERSPFSWRVSFSLNGKECSFTVHPDAIFGLHFLDEPEGKNRAYFFLEVDRATMPVMRKNLRQTSLYRKFLSYYASIAGEIHRKRYGFKSLRVLTVTTTTKRIKTCLKTQRQAKRALNSPVTERHFYFRDRSSISPESVMDLPWIVGDGGSQHL